MSEIEKMKKYVNNTKVNADRYQMNVNEALALAHHAQGVDGLPLDAVMLAFKYGQAKGYRAAKAEVRA